MDNIKYQETIKALTERKYGKSDEIKSRSIPNYPMGCERDYQRVTNAYMNLVASCLKEYLPELANEYNQEIRHDSSDYREDGFFSDLSKKLLDAARDFEQKSAEFNLKQRINGVSERMRKQSFREWKRTVKNTIGLDLIDEYYGPDFYSQIENEWKTTCETAMQGIFNTLLSDVENIFQEGRQKGTPLKDVMKQVNEMFAKAKRNAAGAARDAISTLSAKYAKLHQQDAGCNQYIWSTARDARVRDCHKSFEGKIFSWDYPPEIWYMTKSGIVYTGRYCHPGEDYCCRCVAVPVFNKNTFNAPVNIPQKKLDKLRDMFP